MTLTHRILPVLLRTRAASKKQNKKKNIKGIRENQSIKQGGLLKYNICLTWSISMSCALAPGHSMATFTMSTGGGIAAALESTGGRELALIVCKIQLTHNVHNMVAFCSSVHVCSPREWQHCGIITRPLRGGPPASGEKLTRHLIGKRWWDQSLSQLSCRIHRVSSSANTHPHSRHVNPEPPSSLFPLYFHFNKWC